MRLKFSTSKTGTDPATSEDLMYPNTYTAIDAHGQRVELGQHQVVRVENPLLSRPIIVTALHAPKQMTWEEAKVWAETLNLFGWSWRLPTVEEAFFIADRSKHPATPKEFFPDLEQYEWMWTGTVDAEDLLVDAAPGYAWNVNLCYGLSNRDRQDAHFLVRAVRAGWEDVRGRAPDATGQLSSEAFVRELRDAWD